MLAAPSARVIDRLEALGIPVVHHLPGVGANLHDHLQIALRWRLEGTATLNERMNSPWRMALMACSRVWASSYCS